LKNKYLHYYFNQAGSIKNQTGIMVWIKDIVNHFWYCSKQATNEEHFKVCYCYLNKFCHIDSYSLSLHNLYYFCTVDVGWCATPCMQRAFVGKWLLRAWTSWRGHWE